jgi:hypothetical protein
MPERREKGLRVPVQVGLSRVAFACEVTPSNQSLARPQICAAIGIRQKCEGSRRKASHGGHGRVRVGLSDEAKWEAPAQNGFALT